MVGRISEMEDGEISDGSSSSNSSSYSSVSSKEEIPKRKKRQYELEDTASAAEEENSRIDEESELPSNERKRYRITPRDDEYQWSLPKEMAQYLKDHIDNFIPEKDLKEKVLTENPAPSNCPQARKLDEFLSQFLNSHDERLDLSLSKIESHIRDTFGPLSKLWTELETISDTPRDKEVELDVESLLDMTYKVIILVGQAMNATTYQRRLYVLSAVCRDTVQAKSQLKEKADLFKNQTYLFGTDYRENVLALSKEREKAGNMLKAMGLKKPKHQRSFQKGLHPSGSSMDGDSTNNTSAATRTVRIMRDNGQGSSTRGGRTTTNNQGKLFFTKRKDGKFFLARTPFRGRFSRNSPSYKKIVPNKNSLRKFSRKVKIFCSKLGKNHIRSNDTGHCEGGVQNSTFVPSKAGEGVGKSSERKGDSSRGGSSGHVRKRCCKESSSCEETILEQPVFSG